MTDFFNVSLVPAPPHPEAQGDSRGAWWQKAFRQPKSVHSALLRWSMRHAKLTRSLSIDVRGLTLRGRVAAIVRAIIRRLGAGIMEVRGRPPQLW